MSGQSTDVLVQEHVQLQQRLEQLVVVVALEEAEEVQQRLHVELGEVRGEVPLDQGLELRNVVVEHLYELEVPLETQTGEGLRQVQAHDQVQAEVQQQLEGVRAQLATAGQLVAHALAEEPRKRQPLERGALVEHEVDVLLQVHLDFLEDDHAQLAHAAHQVGRVLQKEIALDSVAFGVFVQKAEEDAVEVEHVVQDRRQHFDPRATVLQAKAAQLPVQEVHDLGQEAEVDPQVAVRAVQRLLRDLQDPVVHAQQPLLLDLALDFFAGLVVVVVDQVARQQRLLARMGALGFVLLGPAQADVAELLGRGEDVRADEPVLALVLDGLQNAQLLGAVVGAPHFLGAALGEVPFDRPALLRNRVRRHSRPQVVRVDFVLVREELERELLEQVRADLLDLGEDARGHFDEDAQVELAQELVEVLVLDVVLAEQRLVAQHLRVKGDLRLDLAVGRAQSLHFQAEAVVEAEQEGLTEAVQRRALPQQSQVLFEQKQRRLQQRTVQEGLRHRLAQAERALTGAEVFLLVELLEVLDQVPHAREALENGVFPAHFGVNQHVLESADRAQRGPGQESAHQEQRRPGLQEEVVSGQVVDRDEAHVHQLLLKNRLVTVTCDIWFSKSVSR